MNGHDHNDLPNDELDRAIREALTVDTDPRRVARLERFWAERRRKQVWRRRALRLVPAAAAAVLLVAMLIVARNNEDKPERDVVRNEAAPVDKKSAPNETALAEGSNARQSDGIGREPTPYEQFIFAARTNVTPLPSQRVVRKDDATAAQDPDEKPADARALVQKLRRAGDAERSETLRQLAELGTPELVVGIVRAMPRGANSDEVVTTVEKIGGARGLARAATAAADAKLTTALAERLLVSDSPDALAAYMALVRQRATRAAALTAADETPSLPVERLMAFLDSEDKSARATAAVVLGHVNGPEITRLLITRLTERPAHATEAWMALMRCRGAMAEEFLTYAANRPQLLGHLNTARVQWAQMTP